jgi:SAM-dependent methyltransferase
MSTGTFNAGLLLMPKKRKQPQYSKRACPICNGEETGLLYHQQFARMSEGSLHNGYDVVVCSTCGCCYADNIPGQEIFDRYYREMSKYEQPVTAGKVNQYDLERFQDTVEKIVATLPEGNPRILEIGCATGAMLGLLKNSGYKNVAGLDPSATCCRIADEVYGVATRCGTLSDNLIPDGSVDYLILIGVLEHLRDVAPAVQKLHAMLAPGGRIFITVPDASKYATGEDAPFQEFSIEHINFFGPQSLSNLMVTHGFERIWVEQTEIRPNFRTVTPVVNAVFQKLPVGDCRWRDMDTETVQGLRRYIEQSKRDNKAVQPALNRLAASKQPVIIWGAGCHTLRLLATSQLAKANLEAIVDSNPRYQGKKVNGVPILKPDAIRGTRASILISSRVFQRNIQQQIKDDLRLENDIVTLYSLGE